MTRIQLTLVTKFRFIFLNLWTINTLIINIRSFRFFLPRRVRILKRLFIFIKPKFILLYFLFDILRRFLLCETSKNCSDDPMRLCVKIVFILQFIFKYDIFCNVLFPFYINKFIHIKTLERTTFKRSLIKKTIIYMINARKNTANILSSIMLF